MFIKRKGLPGEKRRQEKSEGTREEQREEK
jgi:hypothetical protein